jgi:hypothetical protein
VTTDAADTSNQSDTERVILPAASRVTKVFNFICFFVSSLFIVGSIVAWWTSLFLFACGIGVYICARVIARILEDFLGPNDTKA